MAVDMKIGQAAGAYAKTGRMDAGLASGDEAAGAGKPGFGEFLGNAVRDTIAGAHANESIASQALAGKQGITDLVTAISSTELTLSTVVAVRDRVISAYQDIIKMPI